MSYNIYVRFKAVDENAANNYADLFRNHVSHTHFKISGKMQKINGNDYYVADLDLWLTSDHSLYIVLEQIDAVRFMQLKTEEDLFPIYNSVFNGSEVVVTYDDSAFCAADREMSEFLHSGLQDVVDDVKLMTVDIHEQKCEIDSLKKTIIRQQEMIDSLRASYDSLNVYIKEVVLEKFACLEYITERLLQETDNTNVLDEYVAVKIH